MWDPQLPPTVECVCCSCSNDDWDRKFPAGRHINMTTGVFPADSGHEGWSAFDGKVISHTFAIAIWLGQGKHQKVNSQLADVMRRMDLIGAAWTAGECLGIIRIEQDSVVVNDLHVAPTIVSWMVKFWKLDHGQSSEHSRVWCRWSHQSFHQTPCALIVYPQVAKICNAIAIRWNPLIFSFEFLLLSSMVKIATKRENTREAVRDKITEWGRKKQNLKFELLL